MTNNQDSNSRSYDEEHFGAVAMNTVLHVMASAGRAEVQVQDYRAFKIIHATMLETRYPSTNEESTGYTGVASKETAVPESPILKTLNQVITLEPKKDSEPSPSRIAKANPNN